MIEINEQTTTKVKYPNIRIMRSNKGVFNIAERRMFAKTIIGSDAFIEMPTSARLLYYDLGMRADDDGFINSPKSIMRMTGASDDDMKLLIAKKFIIPFKSGVVVIKHWNINNYIQKDRYTETKYKEEKALLQLDENKAYKLPEQTEEIQCIQNVYKMDTQYADTQVRLGKVSIGKDSIDKDNILHSTETVSYSNPPVITLILNDKSDYPIYQDQINHWNELYPAVDILQELKKMKGWLEANPTKRKTKRGILRFINTWLAKEQDKGGKVKTYQQTIRSNRDFEQREQSEDYYSSFFSNANG